MITVHAWVYYIGLFCIGWAAGDVYRFVLDYVRWRRKQMKQRRIVPDAMLKAATQAWHDLPATYGGLAAMVAGLEAALGWLDGELVAMLPDTSNNVSIYVENEQKIQAINSVRRIFLGTETEVPEAMSESQIDRVEYYSKVGNQYIKIDNPSDDLKSMFNPPPASFGSCAAVIMGPSAEPEPSPATALYRAFHCAWTAAVGKKWYDKEDWMKIDALMNRCLYPPQDDPNDMHPILKAWMDDAEAKGVDEATKCNYRRLFERAFQAGRESKGGGN